MKYVKVSSYCVWVMVFNYKCRKWISTEQWVKETLRMAWEEKFKTEEGNIRENSNCTGQHF